MAVGDRGHPKRVVVHMAASIKVDQEFETWLIPLLTEAAELLRWRTSDDTYVSINISIPDPALEEQAVVDFTAASA